MIFLMPMSISRYVLTWSACCAPPRPILNSRERQSHRRPATPVFCCSPKEGRLTFFSLLTRQAQHQPCPLGGGWRIQTTSEQESLLLLHEARPDSRMFLVAGRQVVTKDRLEVLALATSEKIKDGDPLGVTVDHVRRGGGLAVLPWGAGKWLGKRGEILTAYLDSASPEALFVGDNGGRPRLWPRPAPFDRAAARGIRLLPGSDPLPLRDEEGRVGSYGAMVAGGCSHATPLADLKRLLLDLEKPIIPFGQRLSTWRFFRSQIGLRLAK